MAHMRVAVYKFKSNAVDEVTRLAHEGMLPIFQKQSGFIAYEIVKTGEDSALSLSTWESQEQAEQTVEVAGQWVRANIASFLASVENHVGEVALSTR